MAVFKALKSCLPSDPEGCGDFEVCQQVENEPIHVCVPGQKCPPGFVKNITDHQSPKDEALANCVPLGENHFRETWDYDSSKVCSSCLPDQIKIANCTTTQDTLCINKSVIIDAYDQMIGMNKSTGYTQTQFIGLAACLSAIMIICLVVCIFYMYKYYTMNKKLCSRCTGIQSIPKQETGQDQNHHPAVYRPLKERNVEDDVEAAQVQGQNHHQAVPPSEHTRLYNMSEENVETPQEGSDQ